MQNKGNTKNYTIFDVVLIAMAALLVMYCMIYISNSADTDIYVAYMAEKGLDTKSNIDLIKMYEVTMDRIQNEEKITFSDSTPRFLLYGVFINFCWIAMVSIELSKKYAQERMYGDAKWGSPKQFKKLASERRKFYFTDHPPFNHVFHAVIYIKTFKRVWEEGKRKATKTKW